MLWQQAMSWKDLECRFIQTRFKGAVNPDWKGNHKGAAQFILTEANV